MLAAVVTLAACHGGGGAQTAALVSSPSATLPVRVSPVELQLTQLTAVGCPATQPLMTHFDLLLGPAVTDLFVDAVTLRFGYTPALSPLVLTADDLQRLFGSTRIPARTNRTFTLTPQFGCGFSAAPQSLVVRVTFVDSQGQRGDATATATIR